MFVGCCYFAPVASRVSARQPSYFFSAKPKKSNQKKGEPRPCRFAVPCATRSVRGTCKLASLELSTPLNRLRRFPLQGTTPAARQSRFRGVPGRGCASLASPRLLVRCAHIAGVGVSSLHTPHSSRHSGSKRRTQTSSFRAQSRNPCLPSRTHRCCDYAQHDGVCRETLPPSPTPCTRHSAHHPIIPRPYHPDIPGLTRNLPSSGCQYLASCTPWRSGTGTGTARRAPTPSLLTPTTSLLTPHSSLLTPHSSLLTPWLETFFGGEFFG